MILHHFLLIHTIFRYNLHSLKNSYDVKPNLLSTKNYMDIHIFEFLTLSTFVHTSIWIPFKSFDLLQSSSAFVLDWVEFKLK